MYYKGKKIVVLFQGYRVEKEKEILLRNEIPPAIAISRKKKLESYFSNYQRLMEYIGSSSR